MNDRRRLVMAALEYARRMQAALSENTAEWILWERTVMVWEHRLLMVELNDGPPNSIIRREGI